MLTKKQLELLKLLHTKIEENGIPPSFDEMKDELKLKSKSGVHRLISALEERGYISKLPYRARAIEVVKLPTALQRDASELRQVVGRKVAETARAVAGSAIAQLPLMGRIAAGTPIEAISHEEARIGVPESLVGSSGNHYALLVSGESMTGEGILDGDTALIKSQNIADDGEIVVALVDREEATLKKFYRKEGRIILEAANPAYPTQIYSPERVEIQGRLVGLLRSYH
ncbi:MAG: transcriptional repressor LexA [Albidovulum sp.]|nr:transcriptional repressor LexA [Albidovulum sp.]MDE0530944.1 transcriptional repressor LexA [Albidovulum sp.]